MSLVYLDELCDSVSETFDKSTKSIVLINTSDVFNGKVLNHEFVPNQDIKGQFKKLFKKDDILYSEIRPANKHYAFVDFNSEGYVASTKLMVLRPKKDKIRPKYLYYILKNKDVVNFLQGLVESRSGTFPQITFSELSTIDIELPSLENQDVIVNIINNIEDKIECLENINRNLEEQLSLIFDDYFVKCSAYNEESLVKTDWGKIPKEWKNIDFGELIQITSGNRPDEKSETKTSEFNIPLFGASKIMGYTKEYSYNEDILIIGRVGTHGVVQRVNYPCFPSDNTFVIKSKYYGFVYQLLKRIDYDSLNTGSTQPLITQKSLKTVNVVLPDEKTLFGFEKISKIFFEEIYINQNEIKSLTKLRDSLFPKLMSGEIDVSKVNY